MGYKRIILAVGFLSAVQIQAQDFHIVENELRIKVETIASELNTSIRGETVCCTGTLPQFYKDRSFKPVWTKVLADQLIAAINESEEEGLNPQDYHQDKLVILSAKNKLSTIEQADFDLLLTDSFLLLASHLISGKVDPQTIDSQWKVIRREGDPVDVLQLALARQDVTTTLNGIKPGYKAYGRLKEKLKIYRQIAQNGGWEPIDEGESLKPSMMHTRVIQLRRRLQITGDLTSDTTKNEAMYSDAVADAVKNFQKRHGLKMDGNVGKETLDVLNVPVSTRIEQIILNLERCRWLPQDLGKKYIMVNLPAFELELIWEGHLEMEMDVAVGKPYRQTPVFSSQMTYVVFNPYWTVPPTILKEDILPAQIKNTNYLAQLNIKILAADGTVVPADSIEWTNVNPKKFPYTLRQEPGPNNALGEVKFIFPNAYNIYLHDTNHRELFVKSDRALSSGCIRLSKPRDMAYQMMYLDSQMSKEKVDEAFRNKQNFAMVLKEPVFVHIQYWTTFVNEEGILNFRKDMYTRDQKVYDALVAMHF